jgi:hypothetical protein
MVIPPLAVKFLSLFIPLSAINRLFVNIINCGSCLHLQNLIYSGSSAGARRISGDGREGTEAFDR